MREVIKHSTHTHLLNTIKSTLTHTLEKLCKKRIQGMEDFDKLYFWNTVNKTHYGILVWNRNKRLHTINKKHVYKERKETTHVEVGEEDIQHHIYISKISTMYVNMIIRPVYKKKEVSTPPNKMKHISPLQRHVFLPLTCRILKRNHIFSPFFPWLTKGARSYKALPEKHKDDRGWSRGHKESIKKHECNEKRCYGWQDKRKMQNMWKTMHVRWSW